MTRYNEIIIDHLIIAAVVIMIECIDSDGTVAIRGRTSTTQIATYDDVASIILHN